jgi:hypothetical protein
LPLNSERLEDWSAWANNLADRVDPLRAERLRVKFQARDIEKAEVPETK